MKVEDPIHLLRTEHDATLAQLDRMELTVADLNGARRKQALATLLEALNSLEREMRAHSRLEEELLYPALGLHVPKLTVGVMLEEHNELWWQMDQLRSALTHRDPSANAVRWHAIALFDLLRRHLDKENNVIFLMTAQMLSEQEYRGLAEALAKMHEARSEGS